MVTHQRHAQQAEEEMRAGESEPAPLRLSIEEARIVALAAQGLLHPPAGDVTLDDLHAMIERLGVLQVDTISVVERTQYLVLWSRLGAYDPVLLDALLHPHRRVFEYWSHAASIVPMSDYSYYRHEMLRRGEDRMWLGLKQWMRERPEVVRETLEAIRTRGPLASAEFERDPAGVRTNPWDWYGPKESRRALDVLWTLGDLMVHSRRAGQKVYDLRERVLAEAFADGIPMDDALPTGEETQRHFVRRTVRALGIITPGWLWDYFRLGWPYGAAGHNGARTTKRSGAVAALHQLAREGLVVPATVEGLREPAFVDVERLADLEWGRAGGKSTYTTPLTPFDSLIWDRKRAQELFDYTVAFEAYIVPEKRRYGYYSLAILHQGRLAGRLDPKMGPQTRQLLVRAVFLEPGVAPDDALLDGVAGSLRELARFLGARTITVERSEPKALARGLTKRLKQQATATRLPSRPRRLPVPAEAP